MKAEFKINVAAILILAVGVAFFFWYKGNRDQREQVYLNTLTEYEFEFEEYRSEVDSAKITWQETLDASNESLKAALADDSIQKELISYYKNLSQVVKYEYIYQTDTVKVSVPITVEKDTTVNLSDPCYEAQISLFNGGFSLDNFSFDNRQDIVIGRQKSGLRRTQSSIAIRNTNPCINTTGVQSYTVVYEKKWWENPLITVPASVAIGYAAGRISK
jgi:hypothetical protein